jgi:hypothetical protein
MQKLKPNSPVKEKSKNSENERYIVPVRKVKDDLKTAANTEKMFKLLFKQPVPGILVENLLANCPNLHKKFFGKYVSDATKNMKGVTQVRAMQSIAAKNRERKSLRDNPLTFRSSPRITVTLESLLKLRGLIDTGAEINVIIKKIYASLPGLVITENPEIAMVSHSNHHIPFLEICENVKITVKNIEYDVCIFVINLQANHALVLGAPFIGQSKLNLAIKEKSGKQYATVISEDSTNSAKFYTGPAKKRIEERMSAMRSLN